MVRRIIYAVVLGAFAVPTVGSGADRTKRTSDIMVLASPSLAGDMGTLVPSRIKPLALPKSMDPPNEASRSSLSWNALNYRNPKNVGNQYKLIPSSFFSSSNVLTEPIKFGEIDMNISKHEKLPVQPWPTPRKMTSPSPFTSHPSGFTDESLSAIKKLQERIQLRYEVETYNDRDVMCNELFKEIDFFRNH